MHGAYLVKPENFTPPTKNLDDCICGGALPGAMGRNLIANCPCCAGVQTLVWGECDCDNPSHFRVVLPPDSTWRVRLIDNVEPIS